MKDSITQNKLIGKILAAAFWLCVWTIASKLINRNILLPSPARAFSSLVELLKEISTYKIISISAAKIIAGFAAASLSGIILAVMSYKIRILKDISDLAVHFIKSVPVASFIVLLLIWFHSDRLSFAVSFLVALPVIYISVSEGISHFNKELSQMAYIFNIPMTEKIRYIYFPQIYTHIKSSLKTSAGMCFKAGIAAEIIGLPDYSIGEAVYMAKIYFNTEQLVAWTVLIIIVSALCEKIILTAADFSARIIAGGEIR